MLCGNVTDSILELGSDTRADVHVILEDMSPPSSISATSLSTPDYLGELGLRTAFGHNCPGEKCQQISATSLSTLSTDAHILDAHKEQEYTDPCNTDCIYDTSRVTRM